MLPLKYVVEKIFHEGNDTKQKEVALINQSDSTLIYKGNAKDLFILMTTIPTSEQVKKIKEKFDFDLETNLVHYRIRDALTNFETEDPVYELYIYPHYIPKIKYSAREVKKEDTDDNI